MLALTHADEKRQTRILQMKNIPKNHLTRISVRTLLFCCRAAAIAFAPSSPTWLYICKTQVGPHARRRKSKREFSTKNHPQNSSYKVQRPHAAVLLQSGSKRLRSLVADLVAVLQNSCWTSRTPMKKANANSANKEQQQNSSYKVQRLHAAVLLQSGSKRLRSLVADSVAALQNSCWPSQTPMKKANANSANEEHPQKSSYKV
jgi:hypothetical protein